MLTLRAAAELLRSAQSVERLRDLAVLAGCAGEPEPLDRATCQALGIPDYVDRAHVAAGPGSGAIRALLVELPSAIAFRECLVRVATALSSRAPHVLWLILATNRASHVGIAAWSSERHPPRVAALVSERHNVVDSDADTVRSLAAAMGAVDLLVHARWVEVLGREALTRRFYRVLDGLIRRLADSAQHGSAAQRAEVALLYCSRLLFLAFLEAKGWLDGDRAFLARRFDECIGRRAQYHDRILLPLFFGTLNTRPRARAPVALALGRVPFLNGGLFARGPVERTCHRLRFSNEAFGALHGELFSRFRFTCREAECDMSEAAIDPEMLGRAFESLMAAGERKTTGTFYTPHELVERVTAAGLQDLPSPASSTVLDPACGSGAFLVHVLEKLCSLRQVAGDTRAVSAIRRDVLAQSIFGVDRNPIAVWLCQLRLWLAVAIDEEETDPMCVAPLPNLDRNIRVGDSLSGSAFAEEFTWLPVARSLRPLRERYVRASGARKESLARRLEGLERRLAVEQVDREVATLRANRQDLVSAQRGRDLFGQHRRVTPVHARTLKQWRHRTRALRVERKRLTLGGALPFTFAVHFADLAERRGFDLVLGNPPWVRLHRIPPTDRQRLRRSFRVYRDAGWRAGAHQAHAGSGFAGQVDVAALFVERSLELVRPGGVIALLVPVKLCHSLAGGGVRHLLSSGARIRRLEDYAESRAFEAAVYPALVVASRPAASASEAGAGHESLVAAATPRGAARMTWPMPVTDLPFDNSIGSPWLLLPPQVRAAFNRMRAAGTPMAESAAGRPYLGVKCGSNQAFLVRCLEEKAGVARVVAPDGHVGLVESMMLRPVLRGEAARPWCRANGTELIVWTHDDHGAALAALPPATSRWMSRSRRTLAARADARHGARWWALFRTEAAHTDRPRVVWPDFARAPRASVIAAGDPLVPLNSCYVARCRDDEDALTLAAILNSSLAASWLNVLAEPARGGYRRYLGWTMSLLPVPTDWARARTVLAPLGRQATEQGGIDPVALLHACLHVYGLRHHDVAPLLTWASP